VHEPFFLLGHKLARRWLLDELQYYPLSPPPQAITGRAFRVAPLHGYATSNLTTPTETCVFFHFPFAALFLFFIEGSGLLPRLSQQVFSAAAAFRCCRNPFFFPVLPTRIIGIPSLAQFFSMVTFMMRSETRRLIAPRINWASRVFSFFQRLSVRLKLFQPSD